MADRIPPHNDDAEKSVLGAIMQSKDALLDVTEILEDEDFYREENKEIFRGVLALHQEGKNVDSVTLVEELRKRKSLDMVGGLSYVHGLPSFAPTVSNAKQYAEIVAEKSTLRTLISTSTQIMDDSYMEKEDTELIVDRAERSILDIGQNRQKRDFTPIGRVLKDNLKRMEEISKMKGDLIGLTTGFADLNDKTSGFQKSDLIILAARPSVGKTAFALNIALKAALNENAKANVMIFSLEMSKESLGQRLLSIDSRVELKRIRNGKAVSDSSDMAKLNETHERLADTNIEIDDTSGISIAEMKNKCRRMQSEKGSLDLIIIDYLQLMTLGERVENRTQEVSALTRRIKQLAREMDCPVLLLSQLSREAEKRDYPQLSDLRESGSIEQDADIVIFLSKVPLKKNKDGANGNNINYNKDGELEKPKYVENERRVEVAKNRNGETGAFNMMWIGKHTRFEDKEFTPY